MILTATRKFKSWIRQKREARFQYWLERSKKLLPIRNDSWYVSNAASTYCVEKVFIYYAIKRSSQYRANDLRQYKPTTHRTFFSIIQGSALQQAVLFCERENRRNSLIG